MAIHIKNGGTERLIRELAQATSEGLTEAVTVAVRERLARVQAENSSEARLKRLLEISALTAPLLKDLDMDEVLYGESGLYDRETGLPK